MIEANEIGARRWLLAIVLLGLVFRLGWVLRLPVDEPAMFRSLPDQREYLELGRNLLAGKGLVFSDARTGAPMRAFRTPGYPLLVAALGGLVRVIRVVEATLDASTILAVWLLARSRLGAGAALLAALLTAFNPFLIYFCGLILSETLFIALLAWGMAMLARRWVISGAALLAVAVVVRPSAIILPALLGLLACEGTKQRIIACAVGSLATLLILVPWALRNHSALDRWIWTTTNSGITMYDGFHPGASGASDQSFMLAMPEMIGMSEVERDDYLREKAWSAIRQDPTRMIRLATLKLARTWSPIPLSREYGGDRKLIVVAAVYCVPLFVLTLTGLWFAPLSGATKVFLLTPAIYFTIVHAASIGSLRYRIPADVPMCVVAAGALDCVFQRRRSQPDDVPHP